MDRALHGGGRAAGPDAHRRDGLSPRVPPAAPKKLADICFTLNVEDTHIVSYALKKLERLGMVQGERASKEVFYSVTEEGSTVLKRYAEIREQC